MVFPTIEFAAFFIVVLALNWLLMPHRHAWKLFILTASFFFYGFADWRFVLLLAAVTVVNQAAAMGVGRSVGPRRRAWMLGAVLADLGLLGWFKYYGFFVAQVNTALDALGVGAPLPLLKVALPVGISFYTFQAISYVVDVHRGDLRPAKPLDFAVYQAFFPHLVAGPIVRAREFLPQLAGPRDRHRVPVGPALFLIAGGLIKKVVLADLIATRLVDPVFGSPGAHSAPEVLAAIYGYAVQIYCDFSAYTDMAIGLALLMGFTFPRNFDRPYTATSLQDFWRRWHMTLSRWLRDYLYITLGGNRGGRARTYRNLALTMLLGGLWHGAAWTFVIWGGIHGAGLALERWWHERGTRGTGPRMPAPVPAADGPAGSGGSGTTVALAVREEAPPLAVRRSVPPLVAGLVTFHVVCLAWVFFRAPDVGVVTDLLSRLVHWGPAPLVTPLVVGAVVVGLAAQFVPERVWRALQVRFTALPLVAQAFLLGTLIVTIDAIVGDQGVAPFIYFQF